MHRVKRADVDVELIDIQPALVPRTADKAITGEIETHVLGELLGRPGTGHLARPAVGF